MASASSSPPLNRLPTFVAVAASVPGIPATLEGVQQRLGGNARAQIYYDCANVLHPKNPFKQLRNGIFRHAEKIDRISTVVSRWGTRVPLAFFGVALVGHFLKNSSLTEGHDLIRNKLEVTSRQLGIGGAWILGGTITAQMGRFVARALAGIYAPIFMYQQNYALHSSIGRYETCRELEAEQHALNAKERELQPSWARPENQRTLLTVSEGWRVPKWVVGFGAVWGGLAVFAATRGMPLRAPVTSGVMGGVSPSRENFGYSGT